MKRPTPGVARRTLELPDELMDAIKQIAKEDDRSVNQVITRILRDHVRRESAGEDEKRQ